MKITSVEVDWMDGWANDPRWIVTLDQPVPDMDDPRLKHEMRGDLYRADLGDYVHYIYYKGPSQGYGGRRMNIWLADGTLKGLIGGWSSRAGCVNMAWPENMIVDVGVREPEFKYSLTAAAVRMEDFLVFCAQHHIPCALVHHMRGPAEPILLPMRKNPGSASLGLKDEKNYLVKEVYL